MDWPETPGASNVLEWRELRYGDVVEVLDADRVISRGMVDEFSPDAQVVWLQLSYGRGRQAFHRRDGWQLRLVRGSH